MGRGTNRHAGLIVAVKWDICETWQIREVASPQAGVQGRGGAIRIKTSKLAAGRQTSCTIALTKWYTPHRLDAAWWSEGDLNAHVGYVRHPERDALNLVRETMAGCGEYHFVQANYNGERLSKLCQDQHMLMVNTHYRKGSPTCWNALGGMEVESRLDYILLPATRFQNVIHRFVLRREGRRFQLILHRRPRDH